MKNLILFTAILLVFSCKQESKKSSILIHEREIDSIHMSNENKTEDYFKIMKSKNIIFERRGDCKDALEDTIHERKHVYIIDQKFNDSSLSVLFKFKDPCCQTFGGDYKIENDTLIFEYQRVDDEVCSCVCWYNYKLEIKNIRKKIKGFKIIPK